jgi:hypothetical protein
MGATDGEIMVHGHKLPPQLVAFINGGMWVRPDELRHVSELSSIQGANDLQFLSLSGMERETTALRRLSSDGLGHTYGLTSQDDKLHEFAPVQSLVVIAVNVDEEMVALLYEDADPYVVATIVSDMSIRWKRIADTFAEFVRSIGLTVR